MIAAMRGRECAVAIAALVVALAGPAAAEKTRKVRFESEPTGATIFLGGSDSQPLGETPFEKDMPVGKYDVIAELDQHTPAFRALVVKKPSRRDKGKIVVAFSLAEAMGVLRVTGPKGARVQVDKVAYGNLPDISDGIPIPVGPHTVEVTLDGKTWTEFVKIEEDTPSDIAIGAKPTGPTGPGGGDDLPPPRDQPPQPAKPGRPRTGPIVTIGPLAEFGWRNFQYEPDSGGMNLSIDQGGAFMIGAAVEISPFRLTSIRQLHRVSFFGAVGFGVPQAVTDENNSNGLDPSLETFWRKYQAGVRIRFEVGDLLTIDAEPGYGGYVYRFSGLSSDIDRLPDAAYHCVQLGGRIGVRLPGGVIMPYAGGETRIVLKGGALQDRYTVKADADGFAFRAGFDLAYWKLAGRVEGTIGRFTWDLENVPGNPYDATGGTDKLYGVSMIVGYAY